MAKFNEILVGRFNRALQKLTAMKGGPPAAQLATEISSNIQFNQMGADFRYLEGWNRFAFSASVAAVAGISSTLRIRNPAGSNVILVLEKANASPGANDSLNLGMVQTNADLVVSATGINNRLDLRQGSSGSNAILSNSDATHPGSLINSLRGAALTNTVYEFISTDDQEIALLPGQAVDVWETTVNVGLVVSFMWRERFLEDSERS